MASKYSYTDLKKAPGPGTYNHKSTVLGVASMKFPTSSRADLYKNEKVPGPGAYGLDRPMSAV